MQTLKNYAIILASGKGSRFGGDIPKQFIEYNGKTILEHSIYAFEQNKNIDGIVVVITPEYIEKGTEIISKAGFTKILKILKGGELRKDSSYIGVNSFDETEANVLIHDCARPFVTQRIIDDCIEALKTHNAVNTAIACTDTILVVKDNVICDIPKRSELMNCQTPQCFRLSLIKKAHEISANDIDFTDDCGLIVKNNLEKVFIVRGDVKNIKITYASDLS